MYKTSIKVKVKVNLSLLKQVPHHEEVWGNGDEAQEEEEKESIYS
jgi:hypothetical protein